MPIVLTNDAVNFPNNSAQTYALPASGASRNVLTSNGTAWTSAAPPASGVTSLNGQAGAITNTSTNTIWHEIEVAEDDTVFVNVFAEGKY